MKKTLLASVVLSALLAACTTAPTNTAPVTAPTAGTSAPAATQQPAPAATPAPTAKANPWDALKDPNNILSKRSVYFDFDKYDVKLDYIPLVEAHAKFLKANSTAKVLIQGNADERGSSEYNLALGQKRANAVKQAMTTLGVKDAQIEAVSLGKEKPRATGHDEASWAENRRDDILYNGEY